MDFIISLYNLIKTIVCKYETGAINEFAEFEAFIAGGFLQ